MGGKNKQSQRTKNNVRPSSSGRSAELLNANVGSVPSFITAGVSGAPLIPVEHLFPTLADSVVTQYLNSDFTLCIKKLNKKDPITKLKALQELLDLVKSNSVEDVTTILVYWSRVYPVLSADTDHKIREATQRCHGAIVGKVGRAVAPHLKALAPAWLTAQYDDYAPAAAAAQHALHNTFPENKLPELISFCKEEVMEHIFENLIGNTESTVQKKGSAEEAAAAAAEAAAAQGGLAGAQFLAAHAAPALGAWLWARLGALLERGAVWRLARHRAERVRASWFSAMGSIIERYKDEFGAEYGPKMSKVLVTAAGSPATATKQLWGCLLVFMCNVKDWQTWMDKKKELTNGILDMVRNGEWGDGGAMQELLLPLLANLPDDVLTEQFYNDFFEALLNGIDKRNVITSKSERHRWITNLMDCLRYVSARHVDGFGCELAAAVLAAWLERALGPRYGGAARDDLVRHSAACTAAAVEAWAAAAAAGGPRGAAHARLLAAVWRAAGAARADGAGVEGHALLLRSLRAALLGDGERRRIRFDGDAPPAAAPGRDAAAAAAAARCLRDLDVAVDEACARGFERARLSPEPARALAPLLELLREFDSERLFAAVAGRLCAGGRRSPRALYDEALRPWLAAGAGGAAAGEAVVDVAFLLYGHMGEAERDATFESFERLPAWAVEAALSRCARPPHRARAAPRRWARGPAAGAALAAAAARALRAPDAAARDLLLACLELDADGEMLASEAAVARVLAQCAAALAAAERPERAAGLAARLAGALAARPPAGAAREALRALLVRMFTLNLAVQRGDERLSPETWWEVRSRWRDGLAALGAADGLAFLREAVALVHAHLAADKEEVDSEKIDHVATLCPSMLSDFTETSESMDCIDEIVTLTSGLFGLEDAGEDVAVEAFALRYDCLVSNLNCPHGDCNEAIKRVVDSCDERDPGELEKLDLIRFVIKCLFRSIYLRNIVLGPNRVNDDEKEKIQDWCTNVLSNPSMEKEFMQILHDCAILNALNEGYAFWPHYDIIQDAKTRLHDIIDEIIKFNSTAVKSGIQNSLMQKAVIDGYYWSYARKLYAVKAGLEGPGICRNSLDVTEMDDMLTGPGFFHRLQADIKDCGDDNDEDVYKAKYLIMFRSFYLDNVDRPNVIDAEFLRQTMETKDYCNLDPIIDAYYKHNEVMLYETNLAAAPWATVVSNAGVADALAATVAARGWDAPAHHWDFAAIAACSLVASLAASADHWATTKTALLARAALRLAAAVARFAAAAPARCERRTPAAHVARLPAEWAEVFAPDLHRNLLRIVLHLLESGPNREATSNHVVYLDALLGVVSTMTWEWVPRGRAAAGPAARACAAALARPAHHGLKYLAAAVLRLLARPLLLEDADKLASWCEEVNRSDEPVEKPEFFMSYLEEGLLTLQGLVDAALGHVKLCEETCAVAPHSDCHSVVLGYLLLARAALDVADAARGDLVHQYIHIFSGNGYMATLMSTCMRLMPARLIEEKASALPAAMGELFTEDRAFSLREAASAEGVRRAACGLVRAALRGAGAVGARGWWGAAGARAAARVAALVRAYVAPGLLRRQLDPLVAQPLPPALARAGTEVAVLRSTLEVVCSHVADDRRVELVLELRDHHPLAPPRVRSPAAASAAAPAPSPISHTWIPHYLAYQNGTVRDALCMWVESVDRKLERTAMCYICYCRMHPASGRLPDMHCNQCNNKFHHQCLHKWFATSSKPTCPLCRANF